MLAKRVERGDAPAKERMINSNLRLVVSIAKRYQGHGLPLGDLFADASADDPAEAAGEALRRESVRSAVRRLPERERKLLELRFGFEGEPTSLEAIGQELGLTRERVRQLEAQALNRLAGQLEGLVASDEDLTNAA